MQVVPKELEQTSYAVVDDEPLMAQLVSDMLSSANVDVEVFTLGAELHKSTNLPKFKSIILDLSLPDIDGFDLLTKLSEEDLGMSILLISGHDMSTISAAHIYGEALGLKMLGALAKPFTRTELLSILGLLK